jgi:putative metalloenzyme radical SAM/SPASM domain maturase
MIGGAMDDPAMSIGKSPETGISGRRFPSKLFVEVTTQCNLKCSMCVKQNEDGGVPEGSMSPALFDALAPAFPHLDALVLNGIGESLLHPRLEGFIQKAKKLLPDGAWTGFQSNGILLTEKRALSLVRAGLDRICLSADSISQDTFGKIRQGGEVRDVQRAFAALARAKALCGREDFSTGIEFVLMRDNLSELPDTIRWAARNGANFALITQLLPYDRTLANQTVYDTNTWEAIAVYKQWKTRAEREGLDMHRYVDTFMKHFKDLGEEEIFKLVEQMKKDAGSRGIALHVERLFRRDEEWFSQVGQVFEEVKQIGEEEGISVALPEMAPKNNRRCEFVESGSAFVSWDGKVHPCYFLWHRYRCYVGGWEKQVKPWVYGSLREKDIIEIWNDQNYRSFREKVVRYNFPFCFDCSFALCDYVQGEDFEQDCYIESVPCGACLWCTGLFQCLQ